MGHVIGSILIGCAVVAGVALTYRRVRARNQAGNLPEDTQGQRARLIPLAVMVVLVPAGVLVYSVVR